MSLNFKDMSYSAPSEGKSAIEKAQVAVAFPSPAAGFFTK